jgi:hypothetical protein
MLQMVQNILSRALHALWHGLQNSTSPQQLLVEACTNYHCLVYSKSSPKPQVSGKRPVTPFAVTFDIGCWQPRQQCTVMRTPCDLRDCMRRSGWHSLSVEYYRGDTVQPLPTLTLFMRSSPDDADAAFWPIDTRLFRVRPPRYRAACRCIQLAQHTTCVHVRLEQSIDIQRVRFGDSELPGSCDCWSY